MFHIPPILAAISAIFRIEFIASEGDLGRVL